MNDESILARLVGHWRGTCKTWFDPEVLADESAIKCDFQYLVDGAFVHHRYSTTLESRPRTGEEWLAFNRVTRKYQVAWIDSFHTCGAIIFASGDGGSDGFQVFGHYDVGDGHEPWGWRTEWKLVSADRLSMTAYNVAPDGEESLALETVCRREA